LVFPPCTAAQCSSLGSPARIDCLSTASFVFCKTKIKTKEMMQKKEYYNLYCLKKVILNRLEAGEENGEDPNFVSKHVILIFQNGINIRYKVTLSPCGHLFGAGVS
jgi:hypothetical protein